MASFANMMGNFGPNNF